MDIPQKQQLNIFYRLNVNTLEYNWVIRMWNKTENEN